MRTIFASLKALTLFASLVAVADAGPTLKGPLRGMLFTVDDSWHAGVLMAEGHLTQMGRVTVYGEFLFADGPQPGSYDGEGVVMFAAANGDLLVSNVIWEIDGKGHGNLEFRWPGQIVLWDGTTIESTGRFVELPFAGLRATSTTEMFINRTVTSFIDMTGEIVDPDPIDFAR